MRLRLRSITLLVPLLAASAGAHDVVTSASTSLPASARDYPAHPVRIIEPFGAGGGPDLLARALAPKLSELWGHAGIKAVDVPPQPTDAIVDVLTATIEGRITYMMSPLTITLTPIHDGKLLPLGVTTVRRSTLLPRVPTIAEAGVAGFDFPIWYGLWVPAGTPTGVVDTLSRDIARVMATPDLREWIAGHGSEPMSMTRPEFTRFVESESEVAARLNRDTGIKP